VVVLSNQLWRQYYNSDPQIIGKTVLLNLRPHVVVGVMPPDFSSLPASLIGKPALLYRPVAESIEESQRSARHLRSIGRLKESVSLAQAQADVSLIAQRLETAHPKTNANWGIHLVGLQQDNVRDLQRSLWLMLGAVGFVLLIACANVANLLLARSTMRATEIGIRVALGAGARDIIRMVTAQGGRLAILGVVVGAVGAAAVLRVMRSIFLGANPVDPLVFGLVSALLVVVALAASYLPARAASRVDPLKALRAE